MSKQLQDAYIVSAVRTPVGKAPRGVFRNTRPDDLLAHVIKAAMASAPGVDANAIEDAVIGCAMPEAEQGMNVARIGVLLAGLPNTVPAQTINRFCSSGVQAIALAADRIRTGDADLMLAGGTESMSMVPMMGHKIAMNPAVFENENIAIAYGMGITAENVASEWKISREDQDAFALASHQKALAAIAAGEFKDEIAPFTLDDHYPDMGNRSIINDQRCIDTDEGPRSDTSAAGLAKLRTVFKAGGSVTAGNSSQMSDGAGALLLASEKAIKQYNLTPIARFVSFSVAGVRPGSDGHRPDRRDSQGAGSCWSRQAATGLDRTQRSLCRAGIGGDARCGPGPSQSESAGRRHCAGSSARRHRRDPRGYAHPWPAPPQAEVRHGHHVHRHRHGRGGDIRSPVELGKV
jgi:acetyl-CoA acyltransferase